MKIVNRSLKKIIACSLLISTIFIGFIGCSKKEKKPDAANADVYANADFFFCDDAKQLINMSDFVFSGIPKTCVTKNIPLSSEPSTSHSYKIFEVEITKSYKGNFDKNIIKMYHLTGYFTDREIKLSPCSVIDTNKEYLFTAIPFEGEAECIIINSPLQAVYPLSKNLKMQQDPNEQPITNPIKIADVINYFK